MVTFPCKDPMSVNIIILLMAKFQSLKCCIFLIIISGDSPSYFIEMITNMLNSLKSTLTPTRMGLGRVAFP